MCLWLDWWIHVNRLALIVLADWERWLHDGTDDDRSEAVLPEVDAG